MVAESAARQKADGGAVCFSGSLLGGNRLPENANPSAKLSCFGLIERGGFPPHPPRRCPTPPPARGRQ
ncbi:hypothetical protein [Eikenella sp. Marseille-P7795]|uniref:hypothetical protein n=1 Tax=Eikenella sp. Marseille-P7795 TaxID=2866577 RepID=UPI001CE431C8|nr:hypothetical protein [Eikenella sp. Marseille-P7795]